MRINSVNIASFGGIKNKVIDFSDGFNLVYGENENGKSTVMSFIKMMFYGSGRGSSKIEKNLRKKYTPWDGSIMAGSIDFTVDGKNYRLEREFKSSDSTDKLTLTDLDFGTRSPVQGDIGVRLLGLSAAAFERSVFIGQLGAPEKDAEAEGEINSRLSNIVTTGEETVSFNTVNARLEKARTALMSKSGRAGEYDKNLKAIEELKIKAEQSQKVYNDYSEFKKRASDSRAEMTDKLNRAKHLKEKIDCEQDIRNAEKLKEMLNIKAELDSVNEKLILKDGKIADEMFAKKLSFCITKTENAETGLKEKSEEAARIKESLDLALNKNGAASPERLRELAEEKETAEAEKINAEAELTTVKNRLNRHMAGENEIRQSKKKINLPLIIISIVVFALSAVISFIINAVAAVVTIAVGLILLILSFVIRPKDTEKIGSFYTEHDSLREEYNRAQLKVNNASTQFADIKVKYETLNAALNASEAVINRQKALLRACAERISELKEQYETEKEALVALYSRYGESENTEEIKAELEKISEAAERQKEIKQRLNYIAKDLGNISYDEARKKLEVISFKEAENIDFDAVKKEYEEIINLLTERKEEIAAAEAAAKAKLESTENPEEIRRKITEIKKITDSQAEFCNATAVASEVLRESFAELRRSYGSTLEKRAGEIFASLTDGEYKALQISKSFDITAEKENAFGGKEIAYLSSGTADQAYLSLRLALSELIFGEAESLPILLDDALTQYDDTRMKTAVEFLKLSSKREQIIMFTCHNSVYETGKTAGADCKKI